MSNTRGRVFTGIFLVLCFVLGYLAVHWGKTEAPKPRSEPVTVVQNVDWHPANGYESGGKCYNVIGQGGFSQEVPCASEHPVPTPVKQCGAAIGIATFGAWLFATPMFQAAATTGMGCLANLF